MVGKPIACQGHMVMKELVIILEGHIGCVWHRELDLDNVFQISHMTTRGGDVKSGLDV
jgi:hypothetical protein